MSMGTKRKVRIKEEALTRAQKGLWAEYAKVVANLGTTAATLAKLKARKDELGEKLAKAFGGQDGLRRVSRDRLVELQNVKVEGGTYTVDSYSYRRFREVIG